MEWGELERETSGGGMGVGDGAWRRERALGEFERERYLEAVWRVGVVVGDRRGFQWVRVSGGLAWAELKPFIGLII